MITRIFRVRVHSKFKQEFEDKFSSVSVDTVTHAKGIKSVTILKPTKWALDEYAMITVWNDELSLKAFAGENWNKPVIPPEMEQYVAECWIHHYDSWEVDRQNGP